MSAITFYTKLNHYHTIKNGHGILTVTPSSNFSIVEKTINGGGKNEVNIYEISGSAISNASLNIATIKIDTTSSTTKMFTKVPYLKNSKFRLKLVKKEHQGKVTGITKGRVTSYTFDLFYNHSKVSSVDNMFGNNARIYTSQKDVVKKYHASVRTGGQENLLKQFICGNANVHPLGEERILKVEGMEGAEFLLAAFDEYGNSLIDAGTMAASKSFSNGTNRMTIPGLSIIPIGFKGEIPSGGVFNLPIKIPSIYIHKTQTTGSNSAVTKVKTYDIGDVQLGDYIYTNMPGDRRVIHTNIGTNLLEKLVVSGFDPDGDDPNEVQLTGSTFSNTAAQHPLGFVRGNGRTYYLVCSFVAAQPTDYLLKTKINQLQTLTQRVDPILSFDISMASDCTATHLKIANTEALLASATNTATSFSNGDPLKLSMRGLRNTDVVGQHNTRNSFFMQLTVAGHGGKSFTTLTAPKFSNFTNISPSSNNGTEINIIKSTMSGAGSSTATMVIGFDILRHGDTDTNIGLDFNTINT